MVGQTIVRNLKALLSGEPLNDTDAGLSAQIRQEKFSSRKQPSAAMIYGARDWVEAMTAGDRIMVLRDSRTEQDGTAIALYRRPADWFVPGFIGRPRMNIPHPGPAGPQTERRDRRRYY